MESQQPRWAKFSSSQIRIKSENSTSLCWIPTTSLMCSLHLQGVTHSMFSIMATETLKILSLENPISIRGQTSSQCSRIHCNNRFQKKLTLTSSTSLRQLTKPEEVTLLSIKNWVIASRSLNSITTSQVPGTLEEMTSEGLTLISRLSSIADLILEP